MLRPGIVGVRGSMVLTTTAMHDNESTSRASLNSFNPVIHMQESPRHKRFLVGCSWLTVHATRRTPHGVSRLVLAMSAWSVATRRTPSRHCGDSRVYGHTTTTMHDNEHTPPYCGAKTIAIVGDTSWPQTAKQDGDKLSKIFLCNLLGKT